MKRAHEFIDQQQSLSDLPEHDRYFRDATRGGWPFSTLSQGWLVSDCTAEGIKAALAMRSWIDRPISDERLASAVDWLLAMQNPDGGWPSYEKARASAQLEWLNAAEVFGGIMIDYSYVECTSACIQGLLAFQRVFPLYRLDTIQEAVQRGLEFIRSKQKADGSWYGSWGICFTYGTWFGIEALTAAGQAQDRARIQCAARFLLSKQRGDGGWGESYRSCTDERWIEHSQSQVVQSAWALLGLMTADTEGRWRFQIERGIDLLRQRQQPDGSWLNEGISGVFNRNCMIHYDNYRNIMPLWALARHASLREG